MKFVNFLTNLIVHTGLLSPILWVGWNFGVRKFFPAAPNVEWLDAVVVMASLQVLSLYTLRPIQKQVIPVYVPFELLELIQERNEDVSNEEKK